MRLGGVGFNEDENDDEGEGKEEEEEEFQYTSLVAADALGGENRVENGNERIKTGKDEAAEQEVVVTASSNNDDSDDDKKIAAAASFPNDGSFMERMKKELGQS